MSLKVSGTHASDFLASCQNVQVANYVTVPIPFVLIVIELNGVGHVLNERASGWLMLTAEVSANIVRAIVALGYFLLKCLEFNVIVLHGLNAPLRSVDSSRLQSEALP